MITGWLSAIGLIVVLIALFFAAAIDSFLVAMVVVGIVVAISTQKPDAFAGFTAYLPVTWYGWAGLVVGWILIGILWSLFKFNMRYQDDLSRFIRNYESHIDREIEDKIPEASPAEKKQFRLDYIVEYGPKANDYANRIPAWIALWPFSATSYIFTDLLHDFFYNIYLYFSEVYERIARRVFERLTK